MNTMTIASDHSIVLANCAGCAMFREPIKKCEEIPCCWRRARAGYEEHSRRRRNRWGAWTYRVNRTLECRNERGGYIYDVDLDRCRTSAEVLDWIFQITAKTWASPEIVKDLLQAIRDLLGPQATLCSYGVGSTINPRELLAGRPGYQDPEEDQ